jgi:hypothetical protein
MLSGLTGTCSITWGMLSPRHERMACAAPVQAVALLMLKDTRRREPCRGPVPQRTVRSTVVVVLPVILQHPRLRDGGEQLAVQLTP